MNLGITSLVDFNNIARIIRERVIFEGLELQDIGVCLDDIKDDTLLFDDSGLALDSVDGLEIVAGVQREFKINFQNINQQFINEKCATVRNIANLVIESLNGRE